MNARTGLHLLGAAAIALIVWAWGPWQGRVPEGALFTIDGKVYRPSDVAIFLGRNPGFVSVGEAENVVRSMVNTALLEREAARRAVSGERIAPDRVIEAMVRGMGPAQPPTRREIEAYYDAHRDEYVGSRAVIFDVLAVPKAGGVDDGRERVAALRVRAEMNLRSAGRGMLLQRGADGARWAEVGPLPCGGETSAPVLFPPAEVRGIACRLPLGIVSNPVEAEEAWYLVRVTAQRAARNVSLTRATSEIRPLLTERAQNARWTDALEKLRAGARVVVSRPALLELVGPDPEPADPEDRAPGRPPMPPGAAVEGS